MSSEPFSFLFKTPLGKKLAIDSWTALLVAFIFAILLGYAGMVLLRRFIPMDVSSDAEEIFRKIQIGTSCYVALAQGANDVANAIGPLAVIYFIVNTGSVGAKVPVPVFLLLFGGLGIACGISMAGYRVSDIDVWLLSDLNDKRRMEALCVYPLFHYF